MKLETWKTLVEQFFFLNHAMVARIEKDPIHLNTIIKRLSNQYQF